METVYSYDDVVSATLNYFGGDELAANVWITKYALKNKEGELLEKTPEDMHKRLAREFARVEKDFGGARALSEDEIFSYFDKFSFICPQGSPMYGIGNEYSSVSLSNCTLVDSPEDSISGICNTSRDMANLYKRRAGVGCDLSSLRPEGALVNNSAGTTTGAWSFADFYSYICRMIGQNGRRGALALTMDVRHPDIFKFVTSKLDKTKVTGANISVKLSDEFMEAVEKNEKFMLRFPIDSASPAVSNEVNAAELWDLIVSCATKSAEPGILMWDSMCNNLPANNYEQFRALGINPCSELILSAYDACRLIAINLKHLIKNPFSSSAEFDVKKFKKVVSVGQRLSDDLVQLEIEKINNLIKSINDQDEIVLWKKFLMKAERGRRTGLGTYALADMLARMCMKYDSPEAISFIDKELFSSFRNEAYKESIELAKERGPFPEFDWGTEKDNLFIKRLPKKLRDDIEKYGRRNISLLTMAPTGSVSLISKTSSGIEPVFRNSYTRRRKISSDEKNAEVKFVDSTGDSWAEFDVVHENIKDWAEHNLKDGTISGAKLPDYFITSDKIDWEKRVEIQGAITSYIDHSISSTINLPKGTKPETVGEVYMKAWKSGCKGITVYVEGSRDGVLIEKASKKDEECLSESFTPKRPDKVPCDIHQTSVKGEPWVVLVGKMKNCDGDNVPYEVFAGESNKIKIPRKYTTGYIIKRPRKTVMSLYDLVVDLGDDELVVSDIVETFGNDNHAAFTRVISLSLRSGAPVKFVVEQLQKDKDSDMFSFSRAVARVLKRYIKNGERVTSDKYCSNCNSEGLVYKDGCISCTNCGWEKCS